MVNVCKAEGRSYPLFIGCGEYDVPMERKAVEMWAESEPGTFVKIFEGAGHCVNMDVPQAFNAALEAFWQEAFRYKMHRLGPYYQNLR